MVSTMRQGVMATNTNALLPSGKVAVVVAACGLDASRSAWVGCQYNGAAQFWSITLSRPLLQLSGQRHWYDNQKGNGTS
jgi:hypothetical protein